MHTSNDYIYVLMPSLALLFLAAVLVVCWATQRQQRFLLWLSASFVLTAVSISLRSVLKFEVLNHYVVLVNSLFLLGAYSLSKSFSERRQVPSYPLAAGILFGVTMASLYYFSKVAHNPEGRLYFFNIGAALIIFLPVPVAIQKSLTRDWLDRTLLGSYVAYVFFTMLRPMLVELLGENGLDDAMYVNSTYWMTTLMSILFFALFFTVLVLAAIIRETVVRLRIERDTDALTQILNRRAFHEMAQQRLSDPRLYPMAVLACDIDHFKHINDTWGHPKGDEVLRLVASTMKDAVRDEDLLARFGGEEFVILLTKIDLQGAEQVADRIAQELCLDHEVLPKNTALTLSFGIASVETSHHLEGAIKQADQLLYSAKNAGRNRAHVEGRFYPDISFEQTKPAPHVMALLG